MDLSFTAEERAFRAELREFFHTAIPDRIRRKLREGLHSSKEDQVESQRILNARGIAVPHWPLEWGGQDWTAVQSYIYLEELQAASVPSPLAFNCTMVGPVIAEFGSQAHKERFLARAANLDDWWCQGFSEPGAGSDLASLRTTARLDGDNWIVNGQKTWTTLGQYADWIFVLARTDMAAKKQAGISFILVDMKTPGITVRPIQTIDGGREVNEVWFDEVVVPAGNLVGEVNKGWDYAKFLLGNERTGIARIGISKARLKRIRELASMEFVGGVRLIDDVKFREKLVGVEVGLKALEMTQLRVVAQEKHLERGKPNPMSSVLKIKGSELQQATTDLLMDVMGPYVAPFFTEEELLGRNEPQIGPDDAATAAPLYFNMRKVSIYGGSNEIQRNILAKAVLGF
jgi:pimeloyl-CoA dehydrogenase large subunit